MRRISGVLAAAAVAVMVLAGLSGLSGCAGPKRFPPVTDLPPPVDDDGGGFAAAPRLLGVGLAEGRTEVRAAAGGRAEVLGEDGAVLVRLDAGRALVCRRDGAAVAWEAGGRQGRAPTVRLAPSDPGDRVAFDDGEYRGGLLVIPTPNAVGLTVVNEVGLEAYLRGVVPWEIGRYQRDALAALEAQAVAARTYTVSHLGARRDRGFDVFADVMDQVYRGARDEDALCNEAIERTAGLVLRDGDAEIEAYYSACCGGVTSQVEDVWARGPRPYLVSHADAPPGGEPWCAGYRNFHWRESWSRGELEAILARTLPAYLDYASTEGRAAWAGTVFTPAGPGADPRRPGGLRDLVITGRTTSGRVAALEITTDAGTYRVRGDRTRWVLAPASGQPAILRSAMFDLELERVDGALRTIAARGRGYGHGIGLCQTGAVAMARAGRTAAQILAHYYPGAALVRVDGSGR
ncbi:MAG TPA: SpoIID/LytB domain-containing protein [Candidatus Krumholzibacteria bacterium]|nr:SpoIID/LytB domain-containing protein [Candidatus Krumholzibacteria bacterium]